MLASGSSDLTIKLWDTNSGVLINTLTGHNGGVLCLSFDSHNTLASGSADNTIKLWNTGSG
jgi:F-box/WD-40 domain protein MET30